MEKATVISKAVMRKKTHTPGPWTFGVRRDKSMWLSIGDPERGPHYQGDLCSSEEDARLIVSAPDLIDALRECEEYFDDRADADCDQDGYIPNEEMRMLWIVQKALRNAGAK